MKDVRRDLKWADNVRARIEDLNKSGDAKMKWKARQLELLLDHYSKSIVQIVGCLSQLDIAAQRGLKIPPPKKTSWAVGHHRFCNLASYAKNIIEIAERKNRLRLYNRPSDQDYFDVIAALTDDKAPALCRHRSKLPGGDFSYALMDLCRSELTNVPRKPHLSFYLEYLEQKLRVYPHKHIVFKPKVAGKSKGRRSSRLKK